MNTPPPRPALERWEDVIPWFLTAASTVSLVVIAWFLVENILWFREVSMRAGDAMLTTYRLHVYHLHIAMIKRSVGLFSGFALLFLGTSVVFYTLRTTSKVGVQSGEVKGRLETASPGLIAMAFGVVLLLGTIWKQDEFPPYVGESNAPAAAATDTFVTVPLPEREAR